MGDRQEAILHAEAPAWVAEEHVAAEDLAVAVADLAVAVAGIGKQRFIKF